MKPVGSLSPLKNTRKRKSTETDETDEIPRVISADAMKEYTSVLLWRMEDEKRKRMEGRRIERPVKRPVKQPQQKTSWCCQCKRKNPIQYDMDDLVCYICKHLFCIKCENRQEDRDVEIGKERIGRDEL